MLKNRIMHLKFLQIYASLYIMENKYNILNTTVHFFIPKNDSEYNVLFYFINRYEFI